MELQAVWGRCGVKLVFALLLSLFASSRTAWAWGREGHRLTALVAEAYLTARTQERVRALLGEETLADVAPWADEYRQSHPETAPWHFDDIPSSEARYDRQRDCPADRNPASPWRNCLTDRILYFEGRLGDTSLDRADRALALKFLVHLLGDLHQPLHTVADARGGNDLHVRIVGQPCGCRSGCNLHEVWDTELVQEHELSEKKHLALLLEEIETKRWERFAAGNPVSWTNQTHRLGREALVRDGVVLPQAYMDKESKVVDEELAVGGLRLARVLNTILGGEPVPPGPHPDTHPGWRP